MHRRAVSTDLTTPSPITRRARSASPAMMESTLTAVQAALNRRQLQVHELKSKLAMAEEAKEQLVLDLKSKSETIESLNVRFDEAKTESGEIRVKLDESVRENRSLKDRVDHLETHTSSANRSKSQLQQDMQTLLQEKTHMVDFLAKSQKETQNWRGRLEEAEKNNKRLKREVDEKLTLIGKLENVGSSLRQELIATQNQLETTRRELKTMDKIKTDTVDSATTLEVKASHKEAELYRLKMEEKRLRENLSRIEHSKDRAAKMCLEYEETLGQVEEEKVALKLELADRKASVNDMKKEVANLEGNLASEKKGKMQLESVLKDSETERDKVKMSGKFLLNLNCSTFTQFPA